MDNYEDRDSNFGREDDVRKKLSELKTPFYAWIGASIHALEVFGEVAEDMVTKVAQRVKDADVEKREAEQQAPEQQTPEQQAPEQPETAESDTEQPDDTASRVAIADNVRIEIDDNIRQAVDEFSKRSEDFVGRGESLGKKLREELKDRVDEDEIAEAVETLLGHLAGVTEKLAGSFRKEQSAMAERRNAKADTTSGEDNVDSGEESD